MADTLPVLFRLLSPPLTLISLTPTKAGKVRGIGERENESGENNLSLSISSFLQSGVTFAVKAMEIFSKLRKMDQFIDIASNSLFSDFLLWYIHVYPQQI